MKKIVFIISFLGIFFVLANSVSAAYYWRKQTVFTSPSGVTVSGGCTNGESQADGNCGSKEPEGETRVGMVTNYVCCLDANATTELRAPLFEIPNFQIDIPGMEKLSEIECAPDGKGSYSCPIPWLGQYITGIYNYALAIAGILAALVLMAGGLIWLISGGDASKITQAKELIIGSITGLIILVSSYVILIQINPDLINLKSISMTSVNRLDIKFAESRLGGMAEAFKAMPCATNSELTAGIDFYATGYFKYPYQTSQDTRYLCMISMQGSCPNGLEGHDTCIVNGKAVFPNYPHYPACKPFTEAQYNANYFVSANNSLIVGKTIAGPNCSNLPKNTTKVCFKGKIYTITDSGGGIKGRRIDILSGSEAEANSNSGVGKLTTDLTGCK